MWYCHIRLRKDASNICTIILPRGKYRYKLLTMGVSNSPENFQDKTNEMFCGFEFIRSYIDDMLMITKGDCSNHLEKLGLTIKKFKDNWLRHASVWYQEGIDLEGETERAAAESDVEE